MLNRKESDDVISLLICRCFRFIVFVHNPLCNTKEFIKNYIPSHTHTQTPSVPKKNPPTRYEA